MPEREVDWGWLPDRPLGRCRLSWRQRDGVVYLFHAGYGVEEILAVAVTAEERRLLWALLDGGRPLDAERVRATVREKSGWRVAVDQ